MPGSGWSGCHARFSTCLIPLCSRSSLISGTIAPAFNPGIVHWLVESAFLSTLHCDLHFDCMFEIEIRFALDEF
jgi:hypothetical protein